MYQKRDDRTHAPQTRVKGVGRQQHGWWHIAKYNYKLALSEFHMFVNLDTILRELNDFIQGSSNAGNTKAENDPEIKLNGPR